MTSAAPQPSQGLGGGGRGGTSGWFCSQTGPRGRVVGTPRRPRELIKEYPGEARASGPSEVSPERQGSPLPRGPAWGQGEERGAPISPAALPATPRQPPTPYCTGGTEQAFGLG